jgi:hypothetical protein
MPSTLLVAAVGSMAVWQGLRPRAAEVVDLFNDVLVRSLIFVSHVTSLGSSLIRHGASVT